MYQYLREIKEKLLTTALLICSLFFLVNFSLAADDFRWNRFRYPIARYTQKDAMVIGNNIVSFQRSSGGWGKIISPAQTFSKVDISRLITREKAFELAFDSNAVDLYSHKVSTLDNGATHSHVRFLLRIAEATKNAEYEDAALRGINYLLAAQLDKGGWPQNYPNLSSYGGHVTFNDGAMTGAMKVLQEVASGQYYFISKMVQEEADRAFFRGIDFILKSQIVVNGVKTAWGAQHDRDNYSPIRARVYELAAISSAETVGIIKLLMSIKQPSKEVKTAIVTAVEWLNSVIIFDTEIVKVYADEYKTEYSLTAREDPNSLIPIVRFLKGRGYDNVVVTKRNAQPIWARFYDVDTQRPFFVGWSGVKKYSLNEIDLERRTGYKWYGYWPKNLLKYTWPKWKRNNL